MSVPITPEKFASTTFDYIIVGGGTAGLVVAARLSEDPNVLVGVVEAGDWDPNVEAINMPGLSGSLVGNPKYDWGFLSTPQKHADGRPLYLPRGKAVGGTSMVSLCATNPSAREYDAVEALGNLGWNWEEFLKYLKKTETTIPLSPDNRAKYGIAGPDPKWHGDSGPLVKGYPNRFATLHSPFMTSLEKLGMPNNADPDNGHNVGVAPLYGNVDPRTSNRTYSGNAYYEPASLRENLLLVTGSVVSRVTFQLGAAPLVANGVEFTNAGKSYSVTASKGVILCAGSFQSPQLLELSGIGDEKILSKHGIKTLLNLPSVGENLREYLLKPSSYGDHIYVTLIQQIDSKVETVDFAQEPEENAWQRELYKSNEGYLSSAVASAIALLPPYVLADDRKLQDWKRVCEELIREAPAGIKKQLELQKQWLDDPSAAEAEVIPYPGFFLPSGMTPEPKKRYSSLVSVMLHPLSRGSVHIASADPHAPPAIDPNVLSNPVDLEFLLALLKFGLKLYQTAPLGDVVLRPVAPTAEEAVSDESLIAYIKKNCNLLFHPVGTASMLPREDGGVVDPELKVYGTANLRVVRPDTRYQIPPMSKLTKCFRSGRCLNHSNGMLSIVWTLCG
ncbi:GMC oxidoreductase [Trametes meyenii]|nr:GMC oxidoreductase [Trametes meyenii]